MIDRLLSPHPIPEQELWKETQKDINHGENRKNETELKETTQGTHAVLSDHRESSNETTFTSNIPSNKSERARTSTSSSSGAASPRSSSPIPFTSEDAQSLRQRYAFDFKVWPFVTLFCNHNIMCNYVYFIEQVGSSIQ
jgi:hypothetical protein